MRPLQRSLLLTVALASAAIACGCQSGYVIGQGLRQLGLVWSAEPIDAASHLLDEASSLDESRRSKLELVSRIRRHASDELGLDVGDAYTTYYELDDEAVSHVVTAAHPLALVPYRWSFPIVGAVAYKGYFDREDAEAEAARLDEAGWDTSVAPVAAFSTLGWFQDPVLSTMLDYRTGDLADVIFHELAHRTLYFEEGTEINESFATALAEVATRQFLHEQFGADSPQLEEYLAGRRARSFRDDVLFRLHRDLDALYRSELADEAKLRRKEQLFERARRTLEVAFGGEAMPAWSASNAAVLSRGQYLLHVPLFTAIIERHDGDIRSFLDTLRELPRGKSLLPALEAAASAGEENAA